MYTTKNYLIIIHPGQVSVSKPTADDGSTIVNYLIEASKHLNDILEIMSNFGDVSHSNAPISLQFLTNVWISALRYIQSSRSH